MRSLPGGGSGSSVWAETITGPGVTRLAHPRRDESIGHLHQRVLELVADGTRCRQPAT